MVNPFDMRGGEGRIVEKAWAGFVVEQDGSLTGLDSGIAGVENQDKANLAGGVQRMPQTKKDILKRPCRLCAAQKSRKPFTKTRRERQEWIYQPIYGKSYPVL